MSDELAFVAILVGSLGLGAIAPTLPLRFKPLVFAASGVGALVLCCGEQSVHAITIALCTLAFLRLAPQRLHGMLCAAFCFGYLTLVRMTTSLRGPANAVQLMLTLRLTSLAFDSTDGKLVDSLPSQLLLYTCCCHGLFTGPFYTFDEWTSAMQLKKREGSPQTPYRQAIGALARSLVIISIWQAVVHGLPFQRTRTEPWLELPLAHRLCYFFVSSSQYR